MANCAHTDQTAPQTTNMQRLTVHSRRCYLLCSDLWYHNDPKFLYRQVEANCAHTDQTAPQTTNMQRLTVHSRKCYLLCSDLWYHNDPKFLYRQVEANCAHTDQTSLIRAFTVCYSICIFLTKYLKVLAFCLNFR